ncbi:MAG: tRNA lysidine(34) synthetase TilS [Sedimenticola sp.]|nr:tRNA lysidine(34) synthetase TilS [Sedimenticola sp.]
MSFNPETLLHTLSALPSSGGYLVAYSGGLDSHVLLHALVSIRSRLPAPLRAVHVDHGLQADSAAWSRHCAVICRKLDIPLQQLQLGLQPSPGESLEALARDARYRAIGEVMQPGETLLTAHHQDDQAETLLLQLLRGAGLRGLAAMPESTPFATGQHARPLLDQPRDALLGYAEQAGLNWIEDVSNADSGFDRNYLRHRVIPLLRERWPGMSKTLSRSARHCASADRVLDELLQDVLQPLLGADGSVSRSGLLVQPRHHIPHLLRSWISAAGFSAPASVTLSRILDETLQAASDRAPLVTWTGVEVRRFQDRLYLMPPLPPFDPGLSLAWRGETELPLPAGLGSLRFEAEPGAVIGEVPVGRYRIRFRQGGERCRPQGRGVEKALKQLFQEGGVLPWMRQRVPLLEIDGEIGIVGGLCRCQPAERDPLFRSLQVHWCCPLPWRFEAGSERLD